MVSVLPPVKTAPMVCKCPSTGTAYLENEYSEISEDNILQQGRVFKRKRNNINFEVLQVATIDSVI